jgi:Fuc2NAc and GlcNAc transferase
VPAATLVILSLATALASALLVAVVRRASLRAGVVDVPNERSSHTRVTPRGGGIGIILALAMAFVTAGLMIPGVWPDPWPHLAIAAAVIAFISVVDDVRPLPAAIRLLVHLGIGAWAVAKIGFGDSSEFSNVETVIWSSIATIWVAGLINAYNFMDGIDGMAGTQAVIAGAGWLAMALALGESTVAVVAALIVAASCGFLLHNWHPARIFMGDVGSAFLGFTFAVIPLVVGQNFAWAYVAGVLMVWPFVFDVIVTFIRRAAAGENVLRAHRSHLYQRLVATGFGHAPVTLLYGGLASVGVVVATAGSWVGSAETPGTVFVVITAVLLYLVVRRQESRVSSARPRAESVR